MIHGIKESVCENQFYAFDSIRIFLQRISSDDVQEAVPGDPCEKNKTGEEGHDYGTIPMSMFSIGTWDMSSEKVGVGENFLFGE